MIGIVSHCEELKLQNFQFLMYTQNEREEFYYVTAVIHLR